MQNSDGDDLMLRDIRFPLANGVTQKDIAAQVNAIPGMAQESVKFSNWLEDKPKGREKVKQADALSFDATMENDLRAGQCGTERPVLAPVDQFRSPCEGGNSPDPAGAQRHFRHTADRNPHHRADDGRAAAARTWGSSFRRPARIAERVVHQFMDRQYRETFDQPVGMLGNKTPRQAAKSAAGRQKVAEWLKYLENQSATQPDPASHGNLSFEWMWKELGVHDLRR